MLLTMSRLDNVTRFMSVLLIFLFVLAITYFATRYIAEVQKGKTQEKNIKIVETRQIAPGKYIQILQIGKRFVTVAVCKDNITMLTELSEEELDLSVDDASQLPGFKDILEKAKDKLPKKK